MVRHVSGGEREGLGLRRGGGGEMALAREMEGEERERERDCEFRERVGWWDSVRMGEIEIGLS